MYRPSAILTMVDWKGETDADKFQRLYAEQEARLMQFITSPEVREAMAVFCRDVLAEELTKYDVSNVAKRRA